MVSGNPNYFKDANGAVLVLNGSQTWNTLQDWGTNGSPQTLDFDAFVNFLVAHGHNFTLLWTTELPKFCGLPSTAASPPALTAGPFPWRRTGPGTATDGKLKFDLTKFDQSYFVRLRERTQALRNAGIYAGIYLFTGEWLNSFRCPDDGYPFTGANNINGIDDGYTGGSKQGIASLTMTAPNAITRFQDAYVEKVIDTLNDLPNVLWIVSEEAPGNSTWWNDHQISHIRAYESRKPHQHPIGYAAPVGVPDTVIYNSNADWVAPAARISPAKSCGTGKPACKVNINDSDHTYWEMWNESPQQNRNYAWENFMTGNQVLFMDPYVLYYPREKRNLCVSPTNAICTAPDPRYDNFRDNLGYISRYSRKLSLASVTPHGSLSFDRILSGPDPVRRRRVPGLRSVRRLVHGRSLGDAGFAEARGGVVQPIHRGRHRRGSHSRWIILPGIHSAVQRRCGALPGGYRGTRNLRSRSLTVLSPVYAPASTGTSGASTRRGARSTGCNCSSSAADPAPSSLNLRALTITRDSSDPTAPL